MSTDDIESDIKTINEVVDLLESSIVTLEAQLDKTKDEDEEDGDA